MFSSLEHVGAKKSAVSAGRTNSGVGLFLRFGVPEQMVFDENKWLAFYF